MIIIIFVGVDNQRPDYGMDANSLEMNSRIKTAGFNMKYQPCRGDILRDFTRAGISRLYYRCIHDIILLKSQYIYISTKPGRRNNIYVP